jgi:hypothetical protein
MFLLDLVAHRCLLWPAMIRNPAVFTIERPQMQPEWVPFC